MNFNVEVRKKQLQSLDQCITSFKDKVDSILGYLGWSAKKVLENDDRTLCPINSGHTVQLESVVPHVERCRLTSQGYSLTEAFLSEPSADPKSSISLNNLEKIEALNKIRSVNPRFVAAWNGYDPDPRTSDRLFSTYSADERLALYNHAVEHTEGPPVPTEFNINSSEKEKEDRRLTHEEELQQERDAKRRRVKYKSVHTGRNKKYTEIMKEVINNQMEQYIDYLQNSKVTVEEQIPEKYHEETNNSTGYINYEQYNQMSCDISEVTCTNDSTYNDVVHDKSRPSSSIGRHSSHSGRSHEHSRHSSRSRGEKNHKHRYDGDRKRKHSCERHVYRDRGRTHSEDYKEERLHPYKDKERDRVYLHHDDRNKKYVSPDDEQYRKHSHPENDRSRRDPHSDNGKNKRYLHLRTDRDRSFHGEYDRDRFVHKQHQRKRSPPIHRNGEDRHDYKHSYRPEKRH